VGPKVRCLCLTFAGCQHLYWGVIATDGRPGENVALDGFGQRLQQSGRLINPFGQCGAIRIQAFTREDLRLAVHRCVIRAFFTSTCARNLGPGTPFSAASYTCARRSLLKATTAADVCTHIMRRGRQYNCAKARVYVATEQQHFYLAYRSGSGQEIFSCGGPHRENFINSGDIEVGINLLLSRVEANNKTKPVL